VPANRYTKYLTDAIAYQYGPDYRPSVADFDPLLRRIEANLRGDGHDRRVIDAELAEARNAAQDIAGSATETARPPLTHALRSFTPGAVLGQRPAVIRSLIAVALLIVYLVPLALFFSERADQTPFEGADTKELSLALRIVVVEFAHESLTFQIVPAAGALLDDNLQLTKDVTVELDPGTGLTSHVFKAATPLIPWTVHVNADSGDILDYPFDSYGIDFDIEAKAGNAPLQLKTGITHVPHGLQATHTETAASDGGSNVVIQLRRTPTMIFVALLSTISLFLVTLAACNVAWQVARNGRSIEFSMMIWVAALLFVIPTVRNAMPGSVPPGALIDFAIFFWLQIATVGAMASLVWTWTRRKP